MKRIFALTMLLLVPVFGLSSELDSIKWSLTTDEDDIRIWDADPLKSGHVPLKGEMIIKQPIEKVLAVLAETKTKGEWLSAVEKSSVILEKSPYNKVEYYQVAMPTFLISDRTFSLEYNARVLLDGKTVHVDIKSSDKYLRKNDDFVRAHLRDSSMTITPISINGKVATKVSGVFFTSPKGYIPNWVVTRFTRSLAKESLLKLRKTVHKRKYQQKVLTRFANLVKDYNSKKFAAMSEAKN